MGDEITQGSSISECQWNEWYFDNSSLDNFSSSRTQDFNPHVKSANICQFCA